MNEQPHRRFGRGHVVAFLVFYALFAALTFVAVSGSAGFDWRTDGVVAATIGAMSGPFTGAIARHFQSCCVEFSVGLLPFCAGFLALGAGFQFLPLSRRRSMQFLRLCVWCLGLLGWFAGVPVSFLHALS